MCRHFKTSCDEEEHHQEDNRNDTTIMMPPSEINAGGKTSEKPKRPSCIGFREGSSSDDTVSEISVGNEWLSFRRRAARRGSRAEPVGRSQKAEDEPANIDAVLAENIQLKKINKSVWKDLQSLRRRNRKDLDELGLTERTTAESIETLQEQLSTSLSLVDNLEKEKEDHVRQIDDLQTVVSDLTKMLASTLSELNATKTANAQEKVEMENHYRAQLKRAVDDHDAEMDGLVRQMNSLEQMVLRSKSEKGQAAATAARTSPVPSASSGNTLRGGRRPQSMSHASPGDNASSSSARNIRAPLKKSASERLTDRRRRSDPNHPHMQSVGGGRRRSSGSLSMSAFGGGGRRRSSNLSLDVTGLGASFRSNPQQDSRQFSSSSCEVHSSNDKTLRRNSNNATAA